jgi:hypothetical protein
MKDNFDAGFPAGDRYSGVRMQQGEVRQDADWNESASLADRQMTRAVVGAFDSVADLATRADTLVNLPALREILEAPTEGDFRLDAEAGTLRFGDGGSGEVPATGARIESAYRQGAGGTGIVSMVQPFPIELDDSGPAGEVGIQLLEVWSAVADKLAAAQDAISREAYLPSAGRGGGGDEERGDRDPIGGLTALLRDVRSLTDSFAQRLERARTDSPPPGDDD